MPKSKSKRSARTTRSAAFIRTPRILEKLPPTESSIKRLETANNGLLLRIRYGSATRRDAAELYTHLALCWTLVPHINEQYEAYERLARGVLFLETYAKTGGIDSEDFSSLCNIFDFSYDIMRNSTIEEIASNCASIKSGKLKINFRFPDMPELVESGQ